MSGMVVAYYGETLTARECQIATLAFIDGFDWAALRVASGSKSSDAMREARNRFPEPDSLPAKLLQTPVHLDLGCAPCEIRVEVDGKVITRMLFSGLGK